MHLDLTLLPFLDPQPRSPLIIFNKKSKCKKASYGLSFQKKLSGTYHTHIYLHIYLILYYDILNLEIFLHQQKLSLLNICVNSAAP